jgi:gliding motility-associated-like protein
MRSNYMRKILLTFAFIFLLGLTQTWAQDPFITRYDAIKRSERCFTITEDINNQFGAVWWTERVDFSQDTLFNFVVYMGDKNGNGADGLAFVMHNDPQDTLIDPSRTWNAGGKTYKVEAATGDRGGGLGYADHYTINGQALQRIFPSVAVELDTWNNNDGQDGRNASGWPASPYRGWDHTAVVYNGNMYTEQQVITDNQGNTDRILPLLPILDSSGNVFYGNNKNIEDNRCYTFQIRWEVNADGTQTLELWVDDYDGTTNTSNLQLVMTHTDDMINNVFGGRTVYRFGFTGSTGGARNEQTICLLGENLTPFARDDFVSIPLNTISVIDVESNDNDPDGDALSVPVIITPPRHGTANIFDSVDIDFMRYTPNTNFVGIDSAVYVTCDVNSTKCYAKCDTATVYINVDCVPFSIDAQQLAPNVKCVDSLPDNGSAEAMLAAGSSMWGTLWLEDFSDLSTGTQNDAGATAWTSNGCGRVIYNRYRLWNCTGLFETQEIDISAYTDVSVSINLESNGPMENADYLNVFYVLDGGAEVPFPTNGQNVNNFGNRVATADNLNGNTLRIVIRSRTSANNESYFWDNIRVQAIGAGVTNINFDWYYDRLPDGAPDHTGQVINNLRHGAYYITGRDAITGCPSDTVSVTIDSTGSTVDGFIYNIAPFTSCILPYDGELGAGVRSVGDTLTAGYTFEWYPSNFPKVGPPIRIGPIASNLPANSFAAVIIENATGCETLVVDTVQNNVSLPIISASNLADVTSCINPNSGIAQANVGGTTAGYTFEWFIGNSVQTAPPDYVGDTIDVLPGTQNYTVQAIDNVSQCASDPVTITIQDLSSPPVPVVTNIEPQISCDPNAPTGALSAVVDDGGTQTTTGYTFTWFNGPNDVIPARPGYTGGPDVDSLTAGAYRLIVEEDATGCTAQLDTVVEEAIDTVIIDNLVAAPLTSCVSPDGSITITPDGNIADFTYQVYAGNGVIPANLIADGSNNVFNNLDAGQYTVTISNAVTSCVSAPDTISIQDNTIIPDITLAVTDQLSCAPATPTGQIQVSSYTAGTVADYSFAWFEDDTSGIQLSPTTEVISNLDSGDYALLITHNTSGCTNVYYARVDQRIVYPDVDTVTAVASTFCYSSANGELQAAVNGGLGDEDGYEFIWTNLGTGATLASNADTLINMQPGDYEVTVVHPDTLCYSSPVRSVVLDNTVIPGPDIAITDNTSCDPTNPNGLLEVTAVPNEAAYALGDYNFDWYTGADTTGAATESGTNPYDTLSAGVYALHITNNVTSCDNVVLSSIDDLSTIPVIDNINVNPVVNCGDPYGSSATVTALNGTGSVPANYTFEWTNITDPLNIEVIPETGNAISDNVLDAYALPAGDYEVIAYDPYNCPSDPVSFQITDDSDDPVVSLVTSPNSSCDPTFFNGYITADVSGNAPKVRTDFTFAWEAIPGGAPVADVEQDTLAYNLGSGNYRLTLTDIATQCTTSSVASIINAPATAPLIDTVYTQALLNCASPDGEISWNVSPIETIPPANTTDRTYTFYMEPGTSVDPATATYSDQTTGGGDDEVVFANLDFGDFTAVVVDEFTRCQSDPMSVFLDEAPDLEINVNKVFRPSACNGLDGIVEVTASSTNNSSPTGSGFNFSWEFLGDSPLNSPQAFVGTISNSPFLSEGTNLTSGFYRVIVDDNETGCTGEKVIYLESQPVPVNVILDSNNTAKCDPGEGDIQFRIDKQPLSLPLDQYRVYLYSGDIIDPANLLDSADMVDGPTFIGIFNSLSPGTYLVVAREIGGARCFAEPSVVDIQLIPPEPVISLTPTVDFTCTGALNGTGAITTAIEVGGVPDNGYVFEWFVGTDTSSSGTMIGTNQNISDLFAGTYTLVATDNDDSGPDGEGCIYTETVTIQKDLRDLQITDADITDKHVCNADNGEAVATGISEDGVANLITALPDYQYFELRDSNFDSLTSFNGNPPTPFSDLAPGDYYMIAQNDVTKCFTTPYSFEIEDVTVKPTINMALSSPNYSCISGGGTGEITADANGSVNPTEYDFTWFQGTDTSGVTNTPITYAPPHIAPNLDDTTYTVVVTDITDDNAGCVAKRSLTVPYVKTTVTILEADIAITDQTICGPNGTIAITAINEDFRDGNPPAVTNPPYLGFYDAELLNDQLHPINPAFPDSAYANFDAVAGAFTNVPAGTYYVRALNATTGCSFGPTTQAIVRDRSNEPLFAINETNPDESCPGGMPNGALLVTAAGVSDNDTNQGNFTFDWYETAGNTLIRSGATINGLAAGQYRVLVTDNSGLDQNCTVEGTFTVSRDQRTVAVAASPFDQNVCYPNGEVNIDRVTINGTDDLTFSGDYQFRLLDDQRNVLITYSDDSTFTGLNAATYFVMARDVQSNCVSQPFQVRVDDISVDPNVGIALVQPQYSRNPDPTSWTGALLGSASHPNANIDAEGYTYSWHQNSVSAPQIGATLDIDSLDQGVYILEVTSDSTLCTNTAVFNLPFEFLLPEFRQDLANQTVCAPADGRITIYDVNLSDFRNPDTLRNYVVYGFVGQYDPNNPDFTSSGADTARWSNLSEGIYYLQIRESRWRLESQPVSVIIENVSTDPVIFFNPSVSRDQTSCEPNDPLSVNGAIGITAQEVDNSTDTYQYQWYRGVSVDPANIITDSTRSVITGMMSGSYTVEVFNDLTQCTSAKTFNIVDDINRPVVSASATPLTNCNPAPVNGVVAANVINSNTSHIFNWYVGTEATGTPDFEGPVWEDRPLGEFTVRAIDASLGTCISDPVTVRVDDGTMRPVINLQPILPLVNCDPERPNAVVAATVNGNVVGHTFEWFYEDNLYYSGPTADNLSDATYQLVVTNDITQCASTVDVRPDVAFRLVDAPDVAILQDRTSCLVPNGAATSNVNGNVADYIFHYYYISNGEEQTDNRFENNIIYDLDSTGYYVTAEDRSTGCFSEPMRFYIDDATYYPEFIVETTPSNCIEPTGTAEIRYEDVTQFVSNVDYINLETGEEYNNETLNNVPFGEYMVLVEGTEGCINEKEFSILGDVIVYNGVSANNDGRNDIFNVLCIDQFPENNVKIFNRAGMLVYEMDGYDINDSQKSFDGISNRGAAIAGETLPVGTYFYVIDKNDGSKPIVGYLELVR